MSIIKLEKKKAGNSLAISKKEGKSGKYFRLANLSSCCTIYP
ncbi:hypothetical protein CLOLEP_00929 [[Clostridium] leptum DSM 753]|uniref:Uncharacterized protein n=1 Tax=[Clostridium] leptum DSM 753 TaxID=428125 RepID=A7VQU7_9FIRM|nr:hypothetical protein CLOLEP_00929 [[Clostridium] leptum DSM 753]